MTVQEYHQGMMHYFDLSGAQRYLCPTTLLFKEAKIDIIKFDDWLHSRFGNYEDEKKISMKKLIEKEFEKKAMLFIQKLI